ncbi:MAG: hypothetical protein ACE5NW_13720 [Acidiferrobacterales bacterium]
MASRNPDRKIIQTKKARFETYDLDGKLEPEMALLPLVSIGKLV